jgi:hypothetical protein
LDNLRRFLGGGDVLPPGEEASLWYHWQNFTGFPHGAWLVKIPLTPKRIPALDIELSQHSADRRYSVGGQVAWVSWYNTIDSLHEILERAGLNGLVMLGTAVPHPLLGKQPDTILGQRVKQVLDPNMKFGSY